MAQAARLAAVPAQPAARRSRVAEHRVQAQPGFVLHSYPYKETSLIATSFRASMAG